MYLFLAVPNFCGSTVLHDVLATSPNVAHLTYDITKEIDDGYNSVRKGLVEGEDVAKYEYKNLYGPHSIEANMEFVYSNPNNFNWPNIKNIWEKNWELTYPNAPIKMQKSPLDIFRLKSMLKHFPDTKWIVSVRNPYTYIESIMRKASDGMDPIRQLEHICFHVTRVMEIQKKNAELLGNNAYVMTYEDFCKRPEFHKEELIKWIPELKNLDTSLVESDETDKKIVSLITKFPDQITDIHKYLLLKKDIVEYWGYKIL